MTDEDFLQSFESCSLPEEQWTHSAHIRMAYLYLRRSPLSDAIAMVRKGIQRYNASLRKNLAYHETITQAFIVLIQHRIQMGSKQGTFEEFMAENPELFDRKMMVLLTHYRKETLYSPAARETFVSPDLVPFPNLMS